MAATLLPSCVPLDATARLEVLGYLRGVLSADGVSGLEDFMRAYGFAADNQTVRQLRTDLGGAS